MNQSHSEYDVTVIVPTYNRAASLPRVLESLCCQQACDTRYEVIVVDNGSTDDTPFVVARYARRYPFIRYVHEPRRGAAAARNAGIRSAAGPIVAFIDDDVRAAPDWIAAIVSAFARHPEIDCLGGRVEPCWPSTPPTWLTRKHWGPLALQIGRGNHPYLDADHASACLVTANFACRAVVFGDVGLFDVEFLRDEDREFNLRLWAAGTRGKYVDSVVAYADVQTERLFKRYHRAWHAVTGSSHARMRFLEIIDAQGRLRPMEADAPRWFGSPRFLFRQLFEHLGSYLWLTLQRRSDDAFFDECRVRYLVSYLITRWRGRLKAHHGGNGEPLGARGHAVPRSGLQADD